MRDTGIYDYEIGLDELVADGRVDDYFYTKELKQRRLFLQDTVDQWSISPLVRHILFYNIEDEGVPVEERKPIILYISSLGGSVDDGFELIDVIQASKTPVYTVNISYAYSMGFLIMLAGHKRLAMPNAKFLLHDGSNFSWNSTAKMRDQMKFQEKVEDRVRKYIIDRTQITPEEYESKYRVEWYMFADEAKENGVIDSVIGQDAEIDAIY